MRKHSRKLKVLLIVFVSVCIVIGVFVSSIPFVTNHRLPNCGLNLGFYYKLLVNCYTSSKTDIIFPEAEDSFAWVNWLSEFYAKPKEDEENSVKRFLYCFEEGKDYKAKYSSSYAFNLDLSGKSMDEVLPLDPPVPLLVEVNKNHRDRSGRRYRLILLSNGSIEKEPIDGIFQYRLSVPVEK